MNVEVAGVSPFGLARAVLGWQLVFALAAAAVAWLSPVGLAASLPLAVGVWLVGGWAGAVRQTSAIPRPVVKRAVVRLAGAWGGSAAVGYGSLAWVPGVLEVQGPAVAVVAFVVGGIVAASAGGLSLCGIDATSKVV